MEGDIERVKDGSRGGGEYEGERESGRERERGT